MEFKFAFLFFSRADMCSSVILSSCTAITHISAQWWTLTHVLTHQMKQKCFHAAPNEPIDGCFELYKASNMREISQKVEKKKLHKTRSFTFHYIFICFHLFRHFNTKIHYSLVRSSVLFCKWLWVLFLLLLLPLWLIYSIHALG